MTHKIKFSHRYMKMPDLEKTITFLLEVVTIDQKELSSDFVDYDTSYFEGMGRELIKRNFSLPKGKVLILILNSPYSFKANLWTTIRRYTPEKERYYKGLRGQEVKIVILPEEHDLQKRLVQND